MKILSVILLLAALAMAFLAMIFGTRFAALLNKGLCLCAVFGLAWLAVHLFQAG